LTGVAGSPVLFTATAVPGAAHLVVLSGNNQTATVGAMVAPPTVILEDDFNNPVAGVSVTFAVASGGGSVTGGTTVTNSSGSAAVGSWVLGTSPGANTLTAAATGVGGGPLTFAAS